MRKSARLSEGSLEFSTSGIFMKDLAIDGSKTFSRYSSNELLKILPRSFSVQFFKTKLSI
jgi:hypothetical protein